jgi:hypothetical protein
MPAVCWGAKWLFKRLPRIEDALVSLSDFVTYGAAVREFRYHRLRAVFATNAIKLHRSSTKGRGAPYIWIDAPWRLYRRDTFIIASASYPDVHQPGHRGRERAWLKTASGAFPGGYFLSLRLMHCRRFAVFAFSDGWRIQTPADACVADEASWYDDWYARGYSDRRS